MAGDILGFTGTSRESAKVVVCRRVEIHQALLP